MKFKKSYLVVCRTQRQANDLWKRLHEYWSKLLPLFHITASKYPLEVKHNFAHNSVRFVSVKSNTYIDVLKGFRGEIVYGDDVDKFLDEKEKLCLNTETN